jgi:hypothetical protein
MKSTVARLLALALLFVATSSSAVIPEPGLWWNPTEGGRGYGIEMQDDNVFVTYYAYQPDGTKSAFYTTFGKLNARTGVMTGYWAAAQNGQCFGCPHRSPQLSDLGTARLEFSSPMTGMLTLPGNILIPIQRQLLVGETHRDPIAMLGLWTTTTGGLGVYFGDVLWLKAVEPGAERRFSGHRDGSPNRPLLGQPTGEPTGLPMVMLVDTSTSYWTGYAFDNSINRMAGRSWTYLKAGGRPVGAGLAFTGDRLLGNTHASQSVAAQANAPKAMYGQIEDLLDRKKSEVGFEAGEATEVEIDQKFYRTDDLHRAIMALQAEIEGR